MDPVAGAVDVTVPNGLAVVAVLAPNMFDVCGCAGAKENDDGAKVDVAK